jgi:predicted acyltransferase
MWIIARLILLCIAPVLSFALIAWAVWATIVDPPWAHEYYESVGVEMLLMAAICGLITSRLSKRRNTPELRVPFFLNATARLLSF